MSVLHTARINGYEPFACLRDVLEGRPSQPANRIAELLPITGSLRSPSNGSPAVRRYRAQ
jgi:hypothetical protein